MAAIAYAPASSLSHPVTSRAHLPAVYRRRRAVVALVLVGLALAAVWTVLRTTGHDAPLQPVSSHVVVVQPGDTLWSIAGRIPHHGDIRPLVDQLEAQHGTGPLRVGERVVVPG